MVPGIRLIILLILLGAALTLTACNRLYTVSVNERVVYDPRPGNARVRVADPGLQSCINVRMEQLQTVDVDEVEILSCAGLEIESLEGITQLRNLEFLDIGDNELVHLDELARMPDLVSVRAPDNPLQDISGLLGLRTLTSAVLTGTDSIPCAQLDRLQEQLGPDLMRPDQCVV